MNSVTDTTPTAGTNRSKTLTMYTTRWCSDCQITKNFLHKLQIPFQEVDIEADAGAAEYVMGVNGGRRSVPTLVYNGDAASLSNFSRAKLDNFLGKHDLLPGKGAS